MKQMVCFLLGTLAFRLSCCTNYFKRPIVIDWVNFVNKAGEAYEEKFQLINQWHLQQVDSIS